MKGSLISLVALGSLLWESVEVNTRLQTKTHPLYSHSFVEYKYKARVGKSERSKKKKFYWKTMFDQGDNYLLYQHSCDTSKVLMCIECVNDIITYSRLKSIDTHISSSPFARCTVLNYVSFRCQASMKAKWYWKIVCIYERIMNIWCDLLQ
jgi:hypothetical protein